MKNICVLGLGYIGLPTAAILANSGHKVIGVDTNKLIIENIKKGKIHILEKGLEILVNDSISKENLSVSNSPKSADVFIIAVPTPFININNEGLKKPNLDFVFSAAKSISKFIKKGNLIILESTSPVGTSEMIANLIYKNSDLEKDEINIAYCPERVLPGNIIFELKNNHRVIGGITAKSSKMASEIYESFCKGNLLITDSKTAELVKLTENSFRDVNLAFANELSMLCDEYDINTKELIKITNYHPRVNILTPGCGVGGHCIAVDPWFLISDLPNKTNLIKKAREVNDKKAQWVLTKIIKKVSQIEKDLNKKINIGCLGVTFKQDVEDTRESPALFIVKKLLEFEYSVLPCDPNVKNSSKLKIHSINETLKRSDLIVILVAHKEFKILNLEKINFLDFSGIY